VDAELLDTEAVREMYPFLDFNNARFPIKGGILQRRGGTVRHDAVAWGYARGADSRGVDIIQNCEVTGIKMVKGKVVGVQTNRGFIGCKKLGLAAAGNSSEVAAMAGLKLPIESHVLQAFVSEGLKPYIDGVVTFGAGISMSRNRTRADWCSVATLTDTIPMRGAATCRWLSM
jgi:sarcosine oxidase subunit beta